jgi:hypothetical protein
MWPETRRWLSVASVVAVVLASAPLHAQTFGAVADTFVSRDEDTTNFGGFDFAEVGTGGLPKDDDTRALLQFDVSALPSNAPIRRATLRLFISATSADPLGLGVTIASLATGFDETTVTWDTQPPAAPGPTATATMNTPAGEVFAVDVSDLVRAQRAGLVPDAVVLRVAPTDEDNPVDQSFDFRTKEFASGDQRAQLVVQLVGAATAPVLSGWALVTALALVAAVGMRRLRRA